jgi:hypothetical protein
MINLFFRQMHPSVVEGFQLKLQDFLSTELSKFLSPNKLFCSNVVITAIDERLQLGEDLLGDVDNLINSQRYNNLAAEHSSYVEEGIHRLAEHLLVRFPSQSLPLDALDLSLTAELPCNTTLLDHYVSELPASRLRRQAILLLCRLYSGATDPQRAITAGNPLHVLMRLYMVSFI